MRCTATMTVGGSSETLENAFTARPRGFSPSMAVTTVTPLTNCLFTCFIRFRSGWVGVRLIGVLLFMAGKSHRYQSVESRISR